MGTLDRAALIVTLANDIAQNATSMLRENENSEQGGNFESRSTSGHGLGMISGDKTILLKAENLYRARRHREQIFEEPGLFSDPAWDMLLDLYIAKLKGKNVSVSSAGLAAQVPATTALRWVKILEDAGFILKDKDMLDSRRTFLKLTPMAIDKLSRVLAAIA